MLDVGAIGNREEMLGAREGERSQPGPEPAGEEKCLQLPVAVLDEKPMRAMPTAMSFTRGRLHKKPWSAPKAAPSPPAA